ncbi:MAG: hypothetical protein H7Z12_11640 [Rhodospirillaceae bacterium]|nr:hypothetical protein [Rhodospirillales bacterium]
MAISEEGRRRCENCRYWSERCCHALALRDHDHHHPLTCHYFTSEMTRLFAGTQEQASC